MGQEVAAREWATRMRHAAAAAAGVAWALLWFGLYYLDVAPQVFWLATTPLLAPVLFALSRNGLDLAGLMASAYGASLAASIGLLAAQVRGSPPDEPVQLLVRLVNLASLAWLPTWLVAAVLGALRGARRRRRREPPAEAKPGN